MLWAAFLVIEMPAACMLRRDFAAEEPEELPLKAILPDPPSSLPIPAGLWVLPASPHSGAKPTSLARCQNEGHSCQGTGTACQGALPVHWLLLGGSFTLDPAAGGMVQRRGEGGEG